MSKPQDFREHLRRQACSIATDAPELASADPCLLRNAIDINATMRRLHPCEGFLDACSLRNRWDRGGEYRDGGFRGRRISHTLLQVPCSRAPNIFQRRTSVC